MKVKGCLAGLILFGTLGLANAETIAYWRFEEGAKGAEHAADQDGWYKDSSGNGNHLSSWSGQARPAATADCPFKEVPQTEKKNKLALEFDGTVGSGDDLGTFAVAGGSAPMINSYKFKKGWTVECSFKIHSKDRWQVFVGKDGKPGTGEEPAFVLKVMGDNRMQVIFCDDEGRSHSIVSISPIETDEWHSAAVTFDGDTVVLYLMRDGDREYLWQSSDSMVTRVSLGELTNHWTVGRGMWNNGATDWVHGVIDEVRISDTALEPDEFLAVSD